MRGRIGIIACFGLTAVTANATQWYYVNLKNASMSDDARCVSLPGAQTPQQSLGEHVGPNSEVEIDRILKDGNRQLILISPNGSKYAYSTSRASCLETYRWIRTKIDGHTDALKRMEKELDALPKKGKLAQRVDGGEGGEPEFFGYSKPFFDGQRLLISKKPCAVPAKGVDADLLKRNEAQSRNSSTQAWHKSEGHSRFGTMAGCWRKVEKFKQEGILNCNVVNGILEKDQCVVLAKTMFLDVKELPIESPPPRPAQF
jgi:hypothetical protein